MRVALTLILCFLIAVAYAQPANDASGSATTITHSANWCSSNAAYTTVAATADGSKPANWAGGPYNNVWFKFQATTTEVSVSLKTGSTEGSLQNPNVSLHNSSFTELVSAGSNGASADVGISYNSLVVGDWYYINVDNGNNSSHRGTFTLCVNTSTSHDFSANAVTLTHSASWCSSNAAYTTMIGTPDGTKPGTWGSGPNANVWFKFQATTTKVAVAVKTGGSEGNLQFPNVALHNSSMTELQSVSANGQFVDLGFSYSGLTIGDWYYVNVDNSNNASYRGTFTLCLDTSLSQDFAEGAVTLTHSGSWCSSSAGYSTMIGTSDGTKPAMWSGGPNANVWFKFQATTTKLTLAVNTGGADGNLQFPSVALHNASMTEIRSTPDNGQFTDVGFSYSGLTIGDWYYINVDNGSSHSHRGSFTLCLDTSLGQDYPEGAMVLTHAASWCSSNAAYTTAIGSGDGTRPSTWTAGPNNNVWFKFQAVTNEVSVDLKTGSTEGSLQHPNLALHDASLTELRSAASNGQFTDVGLSYNNLTPGNWYYINADNGTTVRGTFTLCLNTVTSYDYPSGATVLSPGAAWCSANAAYTTMIATPDGSKPTAWGSGPHNNAWFKFQAMSTVVTVNVKVGGAEGTLQRPRIALHNAAFTVLQSVNDLGLQTDNTLTYSSLVPGSWYYINVDNGNALNYRGTFTLCFNNPIDEGDVPDAIEFGALKDLYDSLMGDDWGVRTGWPDVGNWPSSVWSWQFGTWYGVTVQDGDVVSLNLPSNMMAGRIPTSTNDLEALKYLNLGFEMGGSFPDLSNLTGLETLILTPVSRYSYYSPPLYEPGLFPSWIGDLINLKVLDLHKCERTGPLPPSFANLIHLTDLNLGDNHLTGEIEVLTLLTELETLNLSNSDMEGSVEVLENFTGIETIDLSGNAFTGPIPSAILDCSALVSLNLSDNGLTGTIPVLSSLDHLVSLFLNKNEFTGFASGFNQASPLTKLNVSDNLLTGAFPDLGLMTSLTDVRFSNNPTLQAGSIPSWLQNCLYIYLENTNRTGTIPTNLLPSEIALDHNQLEGEIPSFGNYVARVSLSHNLLTGPPSFGGYALEYADLSHNKLSGDLVVHGWQSDPNDVYTKLEYVDVSYNALEGSIELYDSRYIRILDVSHNSFTEPISFDIRDFGGWYIYNGFNHPFPPGPIILDLSSNFLSSVHEDVIFSNWDVDYLDVRNNYFSTSLLSQFTAAVKPGATVKKLPQLESGGGLIMVTEGEPWSISGFGRGGLTNVWEKILPSGAWQDVSSNNQHATDTIFARTSASKSDFGKYRWRLVNSGGTTLFTSGIYRVADDFNLIIDDFAFKYRYDARQRMTAKKVPGADWVYMVYDKRDRLVLTQDGNQRAAMQWAFTKYDELNRPVLTGIHETTVAIDLDSMQAVVDNFYNVTTPKWGETTDGSVHYYTNLTYPTVSDEGKYLTVTYYDDYDWKADLSNSTPFAFEDEDIAGQDTTANTMVTGQVTGAKTRVLGTSDWLVSCNYYDAKYRLIQSISSNIKSGFDRYTNVLDFTGKVMETRTTHIINGDDQQTTAQKFHYDHAGRLLKTEHSLNDAPSVPLSISEYNELGQLITKKLHADEVADFNQQVDYRYNIRGWLTSINDPNDAEDDLFSMSLRYNDPTSVGGTAQYNGNISEVLWKGPKPGMQSYAYSYDPMNRLTLAGYNNALTPSLNGKFDERIGVEGTSGYDLNGNILRLTRTNTAGTMDSLTYAYAGNQLLKVTDQGHASEGFKDVVGSGDDYGYDANGNMMSDRNKGISTITYNYLNLPDTVKKSTGEFLRYYYDATGRKLSQHVYIEGSLTKKTDYIGDFFYENDTLKFINHAEGRVVLTGEDQGYQYHLKDHLGNVRVTFSTNLHDEATATLENSNADTEQAKFLRYENARRVSSYLFDHTSDGAASAPVYSNDFSSSYTGFQVHSAVTLSLNGNRLKATAAGSGSHVYIYVPTTPGKNYKVTSDVDLATGPGVTLHAFDVPISTEIGQIAVTANGTYSYNFTAQSSSTAIMFTSSSGPRDYYIDNLLVEDISPAGVYAERLNGSANEKYGLARSMSVMPGDTIRMEVYAKYVDTNSSNWTAFLNELLGQVTAGALPATRIDGSGYASSTASFPHSGVLDASGSSGGPKAYLNWLIFDHNFTYLNGGYHRLSSTPKETGQNVEHERLFGEVRVTEPGYIYVYLSNEETTPVEVYFDDFKVEHVKSPIIQSDDYYPFGMTFGSYQREDAVSNQYQYNGKELQDELVLGLLDYGGRFYDPVIARFSGIDKRTTNYMAYSPYSYVAGNPVNNVDFNGHFILPKEFLQKYPRFAQLLASGIQGVLDNNRIVNALKEQGGWNDDQLKKAFTWGDGPTLTPGHLDGGLDGWLGLTGGKKGEMYTRISIDLLEALEKAEGKDIDYMLFLTAVTVLHEFTHIGVIEHQTIEQQMANPDDDGEAFEIKAYGELVKHSTGSYKRILDAWLNQQQKKREDGRKKGQALNSMIQNFSSMQSGTYTWDGKQFVQGGEEKPAQEEDEN